MSEKVVAFPGCLAPGEVNTYLVEILENMLEDAKAGKLEAAIIAGFMDNGVTRFAWSNGSHSISEMVGLAERLKLEFLQNA